MAQIEEVIVATLTDHVGLSALIGSRVYPDQLPQRPTLPAVTYQRVSTKFYPTRDESHASLERPRFQFDVWANSKANCRNVAQQLRSAIPEMMQFVDLDVQFATLQNEIDVIEPQTQQFRSIIDVFIWHREV